MTVVVFSSTAFKTRYPEFSTVADSLLQSYFDEAGLLYLNNTDSSRVVNTSERSVLLNMLVAHSAMIYSGANGEAASPLVGRISQGAEGSVNVTASMDAQPGTAAWFQQTKYGAAYWQATAKYRTMRYVTRGRRC